MRTGISLVTASLLLAGGLSAGTLETELNNKSYDIAGTFASYDFTDGVNNGEKLLIGLLLQVRKFFSYKEKLRVQLMFLVGNQLILNLKLKLQIILGK